MPFRFPPLHRAFLVSAWLIAAPVLLSAQQPPTQQLPPGVTREQIQQLMKLPNAAQLIRERLQRLGLTPEEIRSRLRAAGYPSSLLDSYLTGDTTSTALPTSQAVDAMSRLGLARFSRQDSLVLKGDTLAYRMLRDSLRADSIVLADSLAKLHPTLKLFGLDVFRQPTTQFQPIVAGPVDDSYILGPGDEIVLLLSGGVEAAYDREVTQGGFIVIPQVGRISVNNLTLGQLRAVLLERLRRVYSSVGSGPEARTRFDVTVVTVRVQRIRVIGEVERPGTYMLAATGNVLAALYEAGGLTERGNFRAVEVRRGSKLVATVDLYDYLVRGITPADVQLGAGDAVFVPVRGARVKITGEVLRPGIYEARAGEGVGSLIDFAGGLTPLAATHAATVFRILPPAERTESGRTRTVITQPLDSIVAGTSQGVPLVAGDSVVIYSVLGAPRNAVTLTGGVWQPGTYEVDPGMHLSDLLRMGGGVRPEAYAERVTIRRTLPDSTQRMLAVPLGPEGVPTPDADPLLREQDEVTVFSRTAFRPQRYVDVSGAVAQPGRVAYAAGMSVRDAILLAGGPTEDALLSEVEVSRMHGAAEGDTLAQVLKVPLDARMVLDPTAPFPAPTSTRDTVDVLLEPYDNVFVRRQPGWERPRNVTLTGQVRFPGRYTILRKDERISDLLERAGGLLPQAYGIEFYRRREPPRDGPYLTPIVPPATDTTQPLVDATWVGRLGVDINAILRNPKHRDNLVLEAGDSINIPAYVPYVRVEGAVNAPANVPYHHGAGTKSYVNGAGGFRERANKGGTFILQPDGRIVKGRDPEPGSVVVVPMRDPRENPLNFLQVMAAIAPTIASLATIIVLLRQ
jgi:polysaccharide export outer membrane protein